jgi:hypothetical protein
MMKNYDDRFEYEQQIMNCWGVTDDIKLLAEMLESGNLTPEVVNGIGQLYEHKFNDLWHYFEASIPARQ